MHLELVRPGHSFDPGPVRLLPLPFSLLPLPYHYSFSPSLYSLPASLYSLSLYLLPLSTPSPSLYSLCSQSLTPSPLLSTPSHSLHPLPPNLSTPPCRFMDSKFPNGSVFFQSGCLLHMPWWVACLGLIISPIVHFGSLLRLISPTPIFYLFFLRGDGDSGFCQVRGRGMDETERGGKSD